MWGRYLEVAQKRIEQGDERLQIPYAIAAINAIQVNRKEAYQWLQKAIEIGWRNFRFYSKDPMFESLHGDEQFKKMMAEVKSMVDEMRKRVEKI